MRGKFRKKKPKDDPIIDQMANNNLCAFVAKHLWSLA
jgi:hypothetical protein